MKHALTFRNRLALTAVVIAGILGASLGSSCQNGSGKAEPITIGIMEDITNTLVLTADEKGFFKANGLDVTIKGYGTGTAANEALSKNEVDVAATTEFVVVGAAFEKEEIRIIAVRNKFENIYLVALKDRGIENVSDLKRKRVGVPRQSINEFYLSRFLYLSGMDVSDSILVNINPAKPLVALTNNEADALVVRHSFVDQVAQYYKNEVVVWPVQSDQPIFGVISSRSDWITRNPALIRKLLRALVQSEAYIIDNPTQAKAIIKERLKLEDSFVESTWPQHKFAVSLEFSLIVAMNDEARWMIDNRLTSEKTVPDFKDYVYVDGLKAVKPRAVDISR